MQHFHYCFVPLRNYLLISLETTRVCILDDRTVTRTLLLLLVGCIFSKCWRPEKRSLPLRWYYRVGIQGY